MSKPIPPVLKALDAAMWNDGDDKWITDCKRILRKLVRDAVLETTDDHFQWCPDPNLMANDIAKKLVP